MKRPEHGMMIVGIDPGLSGAIVEFDGDEQAVFSSTNMPTLELKRGGKTRREINIAVLVALLKSSASAHVFIEQVGAMPGQGVSSMFAFGKSYGIVLGVVAALGHPYTTVPAMRWKKTLGVPAAKDGARARASQLLPGSADHWPLKKDEGRAEAALIALYGWQSLRASVVAA